MGLGVPLVVLVILAVSPLLLPRDGFWSMDEANRYLQVVALSRDGIGQLPPRIGYPGVEILRSDALRDSLRPLPYHYGSYRPEERALLSQYGPALALLACAPYMLLGTGGIYLVPAVFGALFVWLLYRHLRSRGFGYGGALLLSMAGTPVPFFAMTFWSHTIALFLCLWALLMARRSGDPAVCLLLLGMAAVMREEALVMVACVPFLARQRAEWRSFLPRWALGLLLAAALFLLVQQMTTGHLLGTHLAAGAGEQELYGHRGMSWVSERWFVLSRGFLSLFPALAAAPGPLAALPGIGLWALWLGAVLRREGRDSAPVLTTAGLVLVAGACVWTLSRGSVSMDSMMLKHPLLIFPVLWMARPLRRDTLAFIAAVLLLLLLLLRPMHVEDLAWGLRHMLLPCLLLAVTATPPSRASAMRVLYPVCILTCLTSLVMLTARRNRAADLVESAGASSGFLITTSWEQPQDYAVLMAAGHPVLMADAPGRLSSALESCREEGVDEVTVICRRSSSEGIAMILDTLEGATVELGFAGDPDDPLSDVLGFLVRFHGRS